MSRVMTMLRLVVVYLLALVGPNGVALAESWDPRFALSSGLGLNSWADAFAVIGNDVYVGGNFTTAGGTTVNHIARWNGTSWSALGTGTNGTVYALATVGTDLYVGGDFTDAGGVTTTGIAKWNGTSWSAVGSGMNGLVLALATNGSTVYAGGAFTTAGGTSADRIARWDGSTWSALGSGMNDEVWSLTVSGSDLYAGGAFTTAGGGSAARIAKWDGSTWSALGTGIDRRVFGLAVVGSTLYAAGEFHNAGGVATDFFAQWDGSSWSASPGGGASGDVRALAVSGSDLLVVGDMVSIGGTTVHHTAKWDGSTWSTFGSGTDSVALAVATHGTDILVGGFFNHAGGAPSSNIAIYHAGCGDNAISGSEQCDDGNLTDGDGCDSNCVSTACGNAIISAGEQCDDANTANGDGCSSSCNIESGYLCSGTPSVCATDCGDGVTAGSEQCDDNNVTDGDGCDSNCTPTACGNAIVTAPEQCDDGNLSSGDGCDANCAPTGCGNGAVSPGEQCDDGNLADDDGCDSNCTPTGCGNGIVTTPEQCDDGNTTSGDGCDDNCTPTGCGNGAVSPGEQCDDGNVIDGDGCDSNCSSTSCGNGVVTAPEQCDDGNATSGDGCDSNCTPTGCGNGVVTGTEQCDDGNATSGDGCDANCKPTGCGNGLVSAGEQCDDGNVSGGDGCDPNCVTEVCGNGVLSVGEQCDDGNVVSGDGCDADCTSTACGNGIVTVGEVCDDGNSENDDGCDLNCTPTGCGNGIRTTGEACDDGDVDDGDACDSTCTVSAGILDPSFDGDGMAVGAQTNDFPVVPVGLQTSGRSVVAYSDHSGHFAVARYAADGSLDTTFGTGGVTSTAIGNDDDDVVRAMVILPDDRIVVAGAASTTGRRITLVRYLANGALDPSFGTGGVVVTTAGPAGREAHALALAPGGKLVVAGRGEGERLLVARYTSTGALDTTFGGTGIVVDTRASVGTGVAVQSNGSVVTVTGGWWEPGNIVVSRFLSTGAVDTTFDGDGMKTVATGTGNGSAVALQEDGKIVVAGQARVIGPASNQLAFATLRLNPNGSLDTTYDGDGMAIFDPTPADETVGGIAIGSDGKITVSGYSELVPSYTDLILARLRSDGTPDLGFAGNGWVSLSFAGDSRAHGVVLQPDRKIVVGGSGDFFQYNAVVLRFLVGACGDFRAQTESGESCDDGNAVDGDGCESDCTLTPIEESAPAGGTVTTDPLGEGATESAPLQTALTTPNAGTVSIAQVVDPPTPVEGLQIVGIQLEIDAPPATAAAPLSITLTVDVSVLPDGTDPIQLEVLRDGVPIAACTGTPGTASPDPCVQSRNVLAGGDVELTVLTSHASLWSLALRGLLDDEQDCVNAIGKTARGVAKAQAKLDGACLKGAAKNTIPDADACLTADEAGKVQAAITKLTTAASDLCVPPPLFGFGGAAAASSAQRDAALALIHDLLGADVESSAATAGDGVKCQATVLKSMQKLYDTEVKLALACAKAGLASDDAAMVSPQDLGGCVGALRADPTGKIGKALVKLASTISSKCPDPSTHLPGTCGGSPDIGQCLGERVACRICQAFDATWDVGADCDVHDNSTTDASCD